VLELRDVIVSAGDAPLLVDVSLRLRAGEGVALRGPSGCGKTTLLRAVAGLDDAAAGEVLLDGRTPDSHGWSSFRRAVVLVAQTAPMLPGTVRENLARPFAYRSAPEPFPAERARELLDRVSVGAQRLDQDADTLSVGQRQRVALLRAVLVEPRVLLLDEPTSALDADAAREVEELIAGERARGAAVLTVTHDPAQAARLADRVFDLAEHVPEAVRAG
jgi:ABC-type iron transport system FetAB ATPase subunit